MHEKRADITLEDSCISYVGSMTRKDAEEFFNHLMEMGIWFDPDDNLQKYIEDRNLGENVKNAMRDKIKMAFDKKNKIYGSLIFQVVCHDRVSGQFDYVEDFRSAKR